MKRHWVRYVLVVIAAILASFLAAMSVIMPRQSTHWESPAPMTPHAALIDHQWVMHRWSGLRWGDRGVHSDCTVSVPKLRSTSPLAEAAFKRMQKQCEQSAKTLDHCSPVDLGRALYKPETSWIMQWTAHFEINAADAQIISLVEQGTQGGPFDKRSYRRGWNFAWHRGRMIEIELADMFADNRWVDAFRNGRISTDRPADAQMDDSTRVGYLIGSFAITEYGLILYGRTMHGSLLTPVTIPWENLRPYLRADSPVTEWVNHLKGW